MASKTAPVKPVPRPEWVWLWGVILHRSAGGEPYAVTPPIVLRSVAASGAAKARQQEAARGRQVLWEEVIVWRRER